MPPSFPGARLADASADAEATAVARWQVLAEAGELIATLAEADPAPAGIDTQGFARLLRDAEAWRRERAEHGLADLAAVMEPGIAALLAIGDRGADPRPAAQALWREFAAARQAVVALLSLPKG